MRRLDALGIDLRPATGQGLQWFGHAQAGRSRHPSVALRLFDADFIGAGFSVAYAAEPRVTLLVGVNAGAETDRGGNPGGDRRLLGVRLGAEARLTGSLAMSALAGLQTTDYERTDGAFRTVRRDQRKDFELALQYSPARNWILRAALASTRQSSSIPIYALERAELSLSLRRNFE